MDIKLYHFNFLNSHYAGILFILVVIYHVTKPSGNKIKGFKKDSNLQCPIGLSWLKLKMSCIECHSNSLANLKVVSVNV